MRGNEVDARIRAPAIVLVKVGAARQPVGDFADLAFIAFPVTARYIAIFPVPFRPSGRKITDLITAIADVPRLSNQFPLREDRILLNGFEEGMLFAHTGEVA